MIDWCLTPTLPVFQLYYGDYVHFFPLLASENLFSETPEVFFSQESKMITVFFSYYLSPDR